MRRRAFLTSSTALAACAAIGSATPSTAARPPNFIVVLCDDLGYGDTSIYGGDGPIRTPALARMAREGVVLTDYYAPANLCTPSRAGLLTGRYPVRTGLGRGVIQPDDPRGLPLSEITIARALKPAYATGFFGKWHLGHLGAAWPPTRHGFDTFVGIQFSHDMVGVALYETRAGSDLVSRAAVDFPQLQQRFYAHAEQFIEANAERPFFLELALSAPHLPSYPHAPFDSDTAAGGYGAVVQEIDSIVGRLLAKLRALKLERDTVVIFTSDNGPWFEGSSGGLRDRKGGAGYDGAAGVPFVAWAPGRIPPGRRSSSIAMGIDLLPTFRAMAGMPPLAGVELDGRDITAVLTRGAASPHDALVLFDNEVPVAIRTQRWKYVATSYYRTVMLPFAARGYPQLYDVAADRSENYSVANVRPAIADDLKAKLDAAIVRFAPFATPPPPPAPPAPARP